MSGSVVPVFHQEMALYYLRPSFEQQVRSVLERPILTTIIAHLFLLPLARTLTGQSNEDTCLGEGR